MLSCVSVVASVDKKVLKTLSSLLSPFSPFVLALKLLLVLLLAMPEALSGEAAVDLPVLSVLLSLPFYLLCLLLASVHVLVCTSAESSCYFCSLSWGLVFAAVAFSSAMFCILVSMAARQFPLGPKIHGKVSLCTLIHHPNTGTDCDRCYSCIHMCLTFICIQSAACKTSIISSPDVWSLYNKKCWRDKWVQMLCVCECSERLMEWFAGV